MKKRIYIAYTGGTIGMCPSAGGYVPTPGYLLNALANMPDFHRKEMPEFEVHEYVPLLDSAEMSPADWLRIAKDIQDYYDLFDGFVVLHGTDTMAYTASALSFMFENLSKPVIITGSQIPLAELRSDGQTNLLNALYLAANYPIAEVCLFFNNKLYRGNRCTKVDADGFDAFASPNYPSLIDVGIKVKMNAGQVLPAYEPDPLEISALERQPIGLLNLYPGIMPEILENLIQHPVKALVLQSYGVGNGPNTPEILKLLRQATDSGIIVVNTSQCLKGMVDMAGYASGNKIAETGAISGFDMTLEACLTKLHFLLNQELDSEQLKKQMQTSLRGELSLF